MTHAKRTKRYLFYCYMYFVDRKVPLIIFACLLCCNAEVHLAFAPFAHNNDFSQWRSQTDATSPRPRLADGDEKLDMVIDTHLVQLQVETSRKWGGQSESGSGGSRKKVSSCYAANCGCPGQFLEAWCSDHDAFDGWCAESKSNCVNGCSSYWCGDNRSASATPVQAPELIAMTPSPPEQPKPSSASAGKCYISSCGCPGNFSASWCRLTDTIGGWCSESASNCEGGCSAYWCDATAPPQAPAGQRTPEFTPFLPSPAVPVESPSDPIDASPSDPIDASLEVPKAETPVDLIPDKGDLSQPVSSPATVESLPAAPVYEKVKPQDRVSNLEKAIWATIGWLGHGTLLKTWFWRL